AALEGEARGKGDQFVLSPERARCGGWFAARPFRAQAPFQGSRHNRVRGRGPALLTRASPFAYAVRPFGAQEAAAFHGAPHAGGAPAGGPSAVSGAASCHRRHHVTKRRRSCGSRRWWKRSRPSTPPLTRWRVAGHSASASRTARSRPMATWLSLARP